MSYESEFMLFIVELARRVCRVVNRLDRSAFSRTEDCIRVGRVDSGSGESGWTTGSPVMVERSSVAFCSRQV